MSPRWARSFLELSHTSSLKRWWRLPPTTPRNQVKTSIFWKGSSRVVPSPPREVSPRSWGLALDVRDLGEPVQPPPLTCSSGSLFQRRNSYCGSHHSIIAIQQFVCAFSKRETLGWGPALLSSKPSPIFLGYNCAVPGYRLIPFDIHGTLGSGVTKNLMVDG